MNGDVISYNPKQIGWKEFRKLPETAQRDIIGTWKSHGARCTDAAALMGTTTKCLSKWLAEHIPDARWGKASAKPYPSFEWNDWLRGKAQENVTVVEPEPIEKPEPVTPEPIKPILPTTGTLSYTGDPAEILRVVSAMLVGGEYEIDITFRKVGRIDG